MGVLWGKKWRREAEIPQTSKLAKFLVLESQVVGMKLQRVRGEEAGCAGLQLFCG